MLQNVLVFIFATICHITEGFDLFSLSNLSEIPLIDSLDIGA